MKTLKKSSATLVSLVALLSAGFLGVQPAGAAQVENLRISPVGYTVVNGVPDKSHPIIDNSLTAGSGLSSTPSAVGSARSTRSVIGPDGRSQVTNTTASPYRRVGQLTFKQNGGSYICTGWLISASTVVTAGHCLDGGSSTDIVFAPARNGSSDPYGTFKAKEVWVDKRGVSAAGGDWGVIQLDKPIGDTVGWYGLAPGTSANLKGKQATIVGYPGDKPRGTMWKHTDVVNSVDDRNFYYNTDTYGGQSGSAVTVGGTDTAQGIHIWGAGNDGNGATRITGELFNTLAKLRK